MAEKDFDVFDEILEEAAEDAAEDIVEESILDSEEPEEEVTEEAQETSEETSEKKGFFGKKKEKKDKKDAQIEELTDRLKRNLAEFDNFRKRTEKEKSAMYEIGVKSTVEKILPVVDNFERGLAVIPEAEKAGAVAEGMDKIYKQLIKVLEDMGVTPIDAFGKEFDPNKHNAVMHIDDENFGENVVAEVFLKGYEYHGTVIRHAMVKVAN